MANIHRLCAILASIDTIPIAEITATNTRTILTVKTATDTQITLHARAWDENTWCVTIRENGALRSTMLLPHRTPTEVTQNKVRKKIAPLLQRKDTTHA